MFSRHEAQNPFAPPLARLVEAADPSSWKPSPARPWRRYCARRVDQFITFLILSVGLGLLNANPIERLHLNGLLGAVAWRSLLLGLGVLLEAGWLAGTGATPGKWFFGLRVRRPDGRRIGYPAALRRSARVFVEGTGLGLPGLAPFFSLIGFLQTRKRGHTSWDPPQTSQVESRRPPVWLSALAIPVFLFVSFMDFLGSTGLFTIS